MTTEELEELHAAPDILIKATQVATINRNAARATEHDLSVHAALEEEAWAWDRVADAMRDTIVNTIAGEE